MKISKGMYVRTEDGYIGKCIDMDSDNFAFFDKPVYKDFSDTFDSCYLNNIDIKKASFNLIDLIEVGDIVKTPKGKFEVGYVDNNVIYTLDSKIIACLRTDEHLCFENKIINSIITKEQFNSMKYVVEKK